MAAGLSGQNTRLNGLDSLFGDNTTLTVYAGHGNAGLITFRPRLNQCQANAGSNMALGSGSTGGRATIGIWLSCDMFDTGLLDESSSSYRRMNLRQSLGEMGSDPASFFAGQGLPAAEAVVTINSTFRHMSNRPVA